MPRADSFIPHARSDELVITELGDEVLVYDKARDKAHCLNQTAALVWKYSNGKRTVSEIAAAMQNKLHSPVDDQIVWYALGQRERPSHGRSSASAKRVGGNQPPRIRQDDGQSGLGGDGADCYLAYRASVRVGTVVPG